MKALQLRSSDVQADHKDLHRLVPKKELLNEKIDFWGIGAFSILLFVLSFTLKDKGDATGSIGWAGFYLASIVNWPHFAASYQLLYGNIRTEYKKWRFLWAGFIVPIILIAGLATVFYFQTRTATMLAIQTMYFFVGWHYIKQTFGITLLLSHYKSYRLDSVFKWSLKINLFSLWIVNWILLNTYTTEFDLFGFKYNQFGLPESLRIYCHIGFALTTFSVLYCGLRKYVNDGQWPPINALVTWLSIIVWYLPALYHPAFFIFIPFFHSLQYMVCVASYRKSKVNNDLSQIPDLKKRRLTKIKRHGIFFLSSIALGALGFHFVPDFLDKATGIMHMSQTGFFMLSFTLFINIHHYFIDHVIWKKDFSDLQLNLNFDSVEEQNA